jgi:membrane-associated phospholipid phosphatase
VPSLVERAWRTKLACTVGVLIYYVGGYFALNRRAVDRLYDVPRVPLLDDLPLVPWTVVVYNSVFLQAVLAIWLLADARKVKRHALAMLVAFSLTYLVFALVPTQIARVPLPEGESPWLQALRVVRTVDRPATCFPSLHVVSATLATLAHAGSALGLGFLVWTLAIAVSTLTIGQHVVLDLPSAALVAWLGYRVARRLLDRPGQRPGDGGTASSQSLWTNRASSSAASASRAE